MKGDRGEEAHGLSRVAGLSPEREAGRSGRPAEEARGD